MPSRLNKFLWGSIVWSIIFICPVSAKSLSTVKNQTKFYAASNPVIQYTGRIDFSNHELPRFWAPGVYIEACFKGTTCEITINDEMKWGNSHNYVSIVVDDQPVIRMKLTDKINVIKLDAGLKRDKHKITICKSTESGIGYLEFVGIRYEKLLEPAPQPKRRIEFYGNSITCGTGSDTSEFPCNKGQWYDQHNAYMSYGPVTARMLNAKWMLTSVSGIGLMHSCCDMKLVMPDVYGKINLNDNKLDWDFSNYQPDVVTIALGQNDGIQDSTEFCTKCIEFVHQLRDCYPKATIVCLTSPMADQNLVTAMKKYLSAIVEKLNGDEDRNVYTYFFSKQFNNGCGGHPDLVQHSGIANELATYIQKIKNW